MEVKIRKLSDEELRNLGVEDWPMWRKEVSEFDWYYDTNEDFYVLEGEVEVTTDDGKTYRFGEGDFVTFPKGMKCTWKVLKPIKKKYRLY
ncbi:MAG TPA: DUF861 domain-containing protein [Thermotogales bacterium]|nr:DUF861 domain-containing protein [Thermotogales bacterium]